MFFDVLIILWFLLGNAAAYDCKIPPLILPIKNETLDAGTGIALNRGIVIQFTPSGQKVSLRPSFTWNNTRIRNNVDCIGKGNDSVITACQGASGSTFVFTTNDFNTLVDSDWSSRTLTTDDPPIGGTLNQGWGQARLDDGSRFELPFEVWSSTDMTLEFTNKSLVSLAAKSSFVWNLMEAGLAPSNFTGYDHGSRSVNKSAPGEAVLGGINYARVNGTSQSFVNYTIAEYQMPIPCSLVVKVNSFKINNVRGSFPVIPPGTSILACIDPMQNAFYLSDDLFQRWTNFTERPEASNPRDFQTYPKEKVDMLQSLDIELDGGYKATIPQYELVSSDRRAILTDNGQYGVVSNSSLIQAGVTSGPGDYGENYGILLGGIFLSSSYLFVDWENGQFGLAPSKRISSKIDTSKIQKVCSKDTRIPPPPRNSTQPSSSGSSSSDRIALGLGLGISLPSCILAALSVFLFLRYHPGYISRVRSWGHHESAKERQQSVAHVLPPLSDMDESIDLKAVLLTRSREGSTVPAPGQGHDR